MGANTSSPNAQNNQAQIQNVNENKSNKENYSNLKNEDMRESFEKIVLLSNQIDSFANNFLGEEFCNKVALIYQEKMERLNIKVLREIKDKLNNEDNTLNLKLMLQHIPKNTNEKYFVDFFHERLNEYFYKKGIKYQKRMLEQDNISLPSLSNSFESELNYIDFNHVNKLLKETNNQSGGQGNTNVNSFINNINAKLAQANKNIGKNKNQNSENDNDTISKINNLVEKTINNKNQTANPNNNLNGNLEPQNNNVNNFEINERNISSNKPTLNNRNNLSNRPVTNQRNSPPNSPVINQRNSPSNRPVRNQRNSPPNSPVTNQRNSTPNRPVTNKRNSPVNRPVTNQRNSPVNKPITYQKNSHHNRPLPNKRNNSPANTSKNKPKNNSNNESNSNNISKKGQKKKYKYSVPRFYKEPEDLCEESNNRGNKCLMTKKNLCRAIAQNFIVRNNIIAAILTAIPRATRKDGKTIYEGGICFQKFLNLEKASVCVPLNYKQLARSDNMSEVILAILSKSRYIDEKSCRENDGFTLKLDNDELKILKERSFADANSKDYKLTWKANKQYREFMTILKNKYFESLNFLIEILQEMKNNPFISNSLLNQISLKTKNVIDDMYNQVNFYYIYATLALMKSDYLVEKDPSLNQLAHINKVLEEKS